MRASPLLVLALILAGCLAAPAIVTPTAPASAAADGFRCGAGEAVVGVGADGRLACAPALAGVSCPAGAFLQGVDPAGKPLCAVPGAPTPPPATQEVASNLRVVGVYGSRPDTTHDLDTIIVNLELSASAVPADLTKMIVRYGDGTNVATYAYASAPSFSATWIRGAGGDGVMRSGDLVELKLGLAHPLATRTPVQLSLIPETGSPLSADFKTPATYATDTTVMLR
ncbi:MAG: archaeal flagellin FlaB [Thermoplasmata archaeon]|jgi:hypothetical protein|nr:archaeal flagellin FlaB [Thermoplasmata archaeon]